MEVDGSHFFVVGGGMVLGEVVSIIELSSFPVDCKLILFDHVLDPVESHVNGFGSFLFDCVICNALSA